MNMLRVCVLFVIGFMIAGCDYTAVTDPPITLTMRNGVLSRRVIQVSNLSAAKGVEIYLYVADTNRSVRSGNIVIPANGKQEFGALEIDWEFKAGDRGFVRSPQYARELCFELCADDRFRKWFGRGDIPEIDVAEKVRLRQIKEHADWIETVTAAECQRGRELFCAIERANVERAAAGLGDVWPKPALSPSPQGGIRGLAKKARDAAARLWKERSSARTPADGTVSDVAEMKFGTSGEYFECLLGVGRFASSGSKPHITGIGLDAVACREQSNGPIAAEDVRWSVLADNSCELSNALPVLVSASFPCENLRAFWDGRENAKAVIPLLPVGTTKGESFVVVYRDGRAKSFLAHEATLENIYSGAFNTCTNGYNRQIRYITPRGVVKASDAPGM